MLSCANGKSLFRRDESKNLENVSKHKVSFEIAHYGFADSNRVIAVDLIHSKTEKRYFCFGLVDGLVVTVRFTYQASMIRIFGAGYWRKGKTIYENQSKVLK
jgi:uncharacterized protein